MQRRILVPLDGSALSEAVLAHAVLLAHTMGSALTLLRVVHPPVVVSPLAGAVAPSALLYETWEEEPAAARDYLSTMAEQLNAEKLDIQLEVLEGDPAEAVVYAAQDPRIAATAMATHGWSGLRRWVFGSVTERVLHAAPTPMLIVRPQEDGEKLVVPPARVYRTIVVPLDGSPLAEQALAEAQPLAQASGATLLLLSVVTGNLNYLPAEGTPEPPWVAATRQAEADELGVYLQSTADRLREAGLTVRTQLAYGHPGELILRETDQAEADLIVMATHGRGGLPRIWLGSVALKVVQSAMRPVLLVRARPDENLAPRPLHHSNN